MTHVTVVPYCETYGSLDHLLDRLEYLKSMAVFYKSKIDDPKSADAYDLEIYDLECELVEKVALFEDDRNEDVTKILFRTHNFGILTIDEAKKISERLNN